MHFFDWNVGSRPHQPSAKSTRSGSSARFHDVKPALPLWPLRPLCFVTVSRPSFAVSSTCSLRRKESSSVERLLQFSEEAGALAALAAGRRRRDRRPLLVRNRDDLAEVVLVHDVVRLELH